MYAIFEDLARAYVGPFSTQAEIDAHRQFCAERGDSSVYLGTVEAPPEDAFVITPEFDRTYWE